MLSIPLTKLIARLSKNREVKTRARYKKRGYDRKKDCYERKWNLPQITIE